MRIPPPGPISDQYWANFSKFVDNFGAHFGSQHGTQKFGFPEPVFETQTELQKETHLGSIFDSFLIDFPTEHP